MKPEGEEITEVNPNNLPLLVVVKDSDENAPITYDVPCSELISLVKTGAVEAKILPNGEYGFRFAKPTAAEEWFEKTRPILPTGNNKGKELLVSLGKESDIDSPYISSDGRAWISILNYEVKVDDLINNVEKVAKDETPFIEGGKVLLVDKLGRVWILPNSDKELILGYNPNTGEWIRRQGLSADQRSHYNDKDHPMIAQYMITGPAFQSRSGRLFFADRLGVHVLDGNDWSYQFLYDKNIKENRYYQNIKSFSEPFFYEDENGLLYVWSPWGFAGRTGTVGYWTFDGKEWKNVDIIEKVEFIIRHDEIGTWLMHEYNKIAVVKDGQLINEDTVKKAVSTNLQFKSICPLVKDKEGRQYLRLEHVTILEPFEKVRYRIVAMPPKGPVEDLGEKVTAFFERAEWGGVIMSNDGWFWGSNGKVIEAMSPDHKEFKVCRNSPQLMRLRVEKADGKGNLYLNGSFQRWKFIPQFLSDSEAIDRPMLPAVHVNVIKLACPDSLGRMWCTWDIKDFPLTFFDGKTWRKIQNEEERDRRKFIAAFPGTNGSMIFEDDRFNFHLFDANGWVMEKSASELALKHGDRVRAALTYPPLPSMNRYSHFVKDGQDRIWWAKWEDGWGVVEKDRAIKGKRLDLKFEQGHNWVFGVLTPLTDGTRMLVCDEHGNSAIADVVEGKIIKVADSPVFMNETPALKWYSNVLYDHKKSVWVTEREKSVAIGPDGKEAASIRGRLMLEARDNALWSKEYSGNGIFVVRLTDAGETRLEVPNLHENSSITESPDGTVWALTSSSLIRIKADKDKLEIVEEYPLRVTYDDDIWCDRSGRVWHMYDEDANKKQLIRYATTLDNSAKSKQE